MTAEELLFVQLYVSANGERDNVSLWREAHKKEPENKDHEAVRRFLGRPETVALLEKLGMRPTKEVAALTARKPQELANAHSPAGLEARARALAQSFVERAQMIAYWEQVLLIGANEVLADIQSKDPKLSHLVESYKVTRHGVEIRMPSKKTAAEVLTVLKGMSTQTPQIDEKQRSVTEKVIASPAFQRWKEEQFRKVAQMEQDGQIVDGVIVANPD